MFILHTISSSISSAQKLYEALPMEHEGETIVLYPCPGMVHLGSMVEFAKLIVTNHPSFSVTILLNRFPDMPESAYDPVVASVSTAAPSIAFRRLPSRPTKSSPSSPFFFVELLYEIPRLSCPEVRHVLETMSRESRIRAFVIDFFCYSASEVSASLGIDTYFFNASGGCSLAAFLYQPEVTQIADPHVMLNVPGLPPFPVSVYPKQCREGELSKLFASAAVSMSNSRGIITNTFRALEERTLRLISTPGGPTPPVYCIGPLVEANDQTLGGHGKELECLTWLDSQPSKSVVFLCFGRMCVFSVKQLKEIATGLEKSGHRFLWVVRDPPGNGQDEPFLAEFLERTNGRGMVVKNWAPQRAALSHNSVGGFVTHCGWNSILEAVCAGVPMVAWPLYAEQKINGTALVGEMKLALRLNESEEGGQDGFVSAAELRSRVTELMDSDSAGGREVRERVGAMREAALAATAVGGPSPLELAHFVRSLK